MNYYEKILTSNTKIAVAYILQSTLYKYANGIYNYAIKFTLTKTVKNGLFGSGNSFGMVVGVIIIPFAFTIDSTVLVLGLSIAASMFLIGFISFPAILLWLLFR